MGRKKNMSRIFDIIEYVKQNPNQSIKKISDGLQISYGSVYHYVHKLINREYDNIPEVREQLVTLPYNRLFLIEKSDPLNKVYESLIGIHPPEEEEDDDLALTSNPQIMGHEGWIAMDEITDPEEKIPLLYDLLDEVFLHILTKEPKLKPQVLQIFITYIRENVKTHPKLNEIWTSLENKNQIMGVLNEQKEEWLRQREAWLNQREEG